METANQLMTSSANDIIHDPASGADGPRRVWTFRALLVLTLVSAGCSPAPTAPSPRVHLAPNRAPEPAVEVRTPGSVTMSDLTTVPGAVRTVRITLRESWGNAPKIPPLYVVDGHPLGVRADRSVDHDVAQRALSSIDVREIVSIEIVRSETESKRFRAAGYQGLVYVRTARASRARRGA